MKFLTRLLFSSFIAVISFVIGHRLRMSSGSYVLKEFRSRWEAVFAGDALE
jgi:hypothetical protein